MPNDPLGVYGPIPTPTTPIQPTANPLALQAQAATATLGVGASSGGNLAPLNGQGGGPAIAPTNMTDPSTPFGLELPTKGDFQMLVKPSLSLGTSPSTLGQNASANLAPAHSVDVMGGDAGYNREVRNYFIVREKRVANLAAKLDAETGKALRDQLAQKIAILQNSAEYRAADGATQAQILDKAYQDTEATAISSGAVTADGAGAASDTPDNTTSLGYTPQDIAALQAVASQYLVPYAQQAQASGGMAQASLQSLASQAATPQMRVYATQAANAQKAAQDQLAAAYMAQVSAAPTMAVIQQNTQLQQQMAQMQQQILGYQARSQQPASTGGDFASILAQAQAGGATTQAGG